MINFFFLQKTTTTKWSCYSYNPNNFLFTQSPILIGPLLIPCIFVKPVTCSLWRFVNICSLGFEACIQERKSTWIFFLETISSLSERYPKTLTPSGKIVLLHWLFIWLCMSGIFNLTLSFSCTTAIWQLIFIRCFHTESMSCLENKLWCKWINPSEYTVNWHHLIIVYFISRFQHHNIFCF